MIKGIYTLEALADMLHLRRGVDRSTLCNTAATEITDLRSQLTTALAERDEARERVKELEAQATAPGYPYQTLKGMVASLEGCNQRQADTIRQYKSQLDTAWQQGAEVMREAAMHVCAPYTHGQWFMEAIRALPVPERKEG